MNKKYKYSYRKSSKGKILAQKLKNINIDDTMYKTGAILANIYTVLDGVTLTGGSK